MKECCEPWEDNFGSSAVASVVLGRGFFKLIVGSTGLEPVTDGL